MIKWWNPWEDDKDRVAGYFVKWIDKKKRIAVIAMNKEDLVV